MKKVNGVRLFMLMSSMILTQFCLASDRAGQNTPDTQPPGPMSPIGRIVAAVRGNSPFAWMKNNKGKEVTFEDPKKILEREFPTGFQISDDNGNMEVTCSYLRKYDEEKKQWALGDNGGAVWEPVQELGTDRSNSWEMSATLQQNSENNWSVEVISSTNYAVLTSGKKEIITGNLDTVRARLLQVMNPKSKYNLD